MTPDLDSLRPMAAHLRSLQRLTRPFSADYDAIAITLAAMDETAEHFTGERSFYGARNDTVGPIKPRG